MRVVAGLLVATVFVHGAVAEEIKLRCDPLSGSDAPIIVTIDMDNKKVQLGTAPDNEWYDDNRVGTRNEVDIPGDGNQRPINGCTMKDTEFVNILSKEISF